MINCKICGQDCKSFGSLSKHIRDAHHGYTSQKYYNEFSKVLGQDKCKICSKDTKFVNINVGYKETCCQKCSGTLNRQRLKSNKEKHNAFAKKVAKNQERIWQERKESGEDKKIHAKVGNTIKQINSTLTKEQLNKRYAWLNKLTVDEKAHWVNTVMKKTGAHNWWETASSDEKQTVINRRNASKLGITLEEYLNRYDNLDDYSQYRWYVWILTERTYKEHRHIIDPHNMRSPAYHLDHKFSVVRGYHLQIDPKIIASVHNLEMLPASHNSRKGGKCSINIETLMEMYNGI